MEPEMHVKILTCYGCIAEYAKVVNPQATGMG